MNSFYSTNYSILMNSVERACGLGKLLSVKAIQRLRKSKIFFCMGEFRPIPITILYNPVKKRGSSPSCRVRKTQIERERERDKHTHSSYRERQNESNKANINRFLFCGKNLASEIFDIYTFPVSMCIKL